MNWVGSSKVSFHDIGMTQEKLNLMERLSVESGYWRRCSMYVKAITNRKLTSLTNSQRTWLTTIIMDLGNELYKESWRY